MSGISVSVEGPDQAGEARRTAVAMAKGLGFDEAESARAGIIVTECANNLWKHARSGEVLLSPVHHPNQQEGIEILALDKGPGMDPARCFTDGYSTAGSQGAGLGAVRRLSSTCDVYSVAGRGTALLSRLFKHRSAAGATERLEWGGVCIPVHGETVCGDGYAVLEFADFALAMVVDGLGHGPAAAECSAAARAALESSTASDPVELLEDIHIALRPTRGAAVTVVRLDFRARSVRVAGIGNVAGFITDYPDERHLAAQPGIVGHDLRTVREFTYSWPAHAHLLLYSDGISTHWSLGSYDGLLSHDPTLIAGVVYRDWKRSRDDATVLVIREKAA